MSHSLKQKSYGKERNILIQIFKKTQQRVFKILKFFYFAKLICGVKLWL